MAAALTAFSGDSLNALLAANPEYDMHRRVAGWSLAYGRSQPLRRRLEPARAG